MREGYAFMFVYEDGQTMSMAVTESKLDGQGSNLAQLLAGMEKVAGDVVYLHLTKCYSLIKILHNVCGLIIDHDSLTAAVHKLNF